jgi:mRNA interferase YafQ
MRTIRRTSQFKRDVKHKQRQGKDLGKLKKVLESLVKDKRLSQKYRDHVLVGQYKGTRECHIEPDWLLIYELAESEVVLIGAGSRSDLFR